MIEVSCFMHAAEDIHLHAIAVPSNNNREWIVRVRRLAHKTLELAANKMHCYHGRQAWMLYSDQPANELDLDWKTKLHPLGDGGRGISDLLNFIRLCIVYDTNTKSIEAKHKPRVFASVSPIPEASKRCFGLEHKTFPNNSEAIDT